LRFRIACRRTVVIQLLAVAAAALKQDSRRPRLAIRATRIECFDQMSCQGLVALFCSLTAWPDLACSSARAFEGLPVPIEYSPRGVKSTCYLGGCSKALTPTKCRAVVDIPTKCRALIAIGQIRHRCNFVTLRAHVDLRFGYAIAV
jgi:hypothetical protein